MREIVIAREISAICLTCDKVIAEIDLESLCDPDKYIISRRVVYESAQRHKELAPEHRVMVYDRVEHDRRTIPN